MGERLAHACMGQAAQALVKLTADAHSKRCDAHIPASRVKSGGRFGILIPRLRPGSCVGRRWCGSCRR